MSSMSDIAEQPNQAPSVTNGNAIQVSNTTSGYFLGRQPRNWEIGSHEGGTIATRPHLPLSLHSLSEPHNNPNKASSKTATPVTTSTTIQQSVTTSANLSTPLAAASSSDVADLIRHDASRPELLQENQRVSTSSEDNTDRVAATRSSVSSAPSNASRPAPNTAHAGLVSPITRQQPNLPIQNNAVRQSLSRRDSQFDPNNFYSHHSIGVQATTESTPLQVTYNNSVVASNGSNIRAAPNVPSPLTRNPTAHYVQRTTNIIPIQGQLQSLPSFPNEGNVQYVSNRAIPSSSLTLDTGNTMGLVSLWNDLRANIARLGQGPEVEKFATVRIDWLLYAIRASDDFYLLLHQFVCMRAERMNDLLHFASFEPCHFEGLRLLEWIFGLNVSLSLPVIRLLGNFPVPLSIYQANSTCRPWILDAKAFLEGFAWRWGFLRNEVIRRACPPPAREIFELLGVYHPILSQEIFLSFCHQLYSQFQRSTPQNLIFLDLFKQSQHLLFQRLQNQTERRSESQSLQVEIGVFARNFSSIPRQVRVLHLENLLGHPPIVPKRSTIHLIRLESARGSTQAGTQARSTTLPHVLQSQSSASTVNPGYVVTTTNTLPSHRDTAPLLFPREGQNPPIFAQPDPHRTALHQVSVIEPQQIQDDQSISEESFRMYVFLDHFLGEAKIIKNDTSYESWSILLSTDLSRSRVEEHAPSEKGDFVKKRRVLRNSSVIIYLRCVELTSENISKDKSLFSSSPTSWPQHIFVSINDTHLDFRRKGQHGKDLPCDVTYLLREGLNDVELSYHVATSEVGKKFALAFEVCRSYDHPRTIELTGSLDAKSSLDATVQLLQRQNEDEDVVMSDPWVSIDLIDPITARVSDIPVKGKSCFHRECFDLEAYLRSRPCRNKDGLVHPDEWRCPICRKDTRPTNLVVDMFLVQVKEKLSNDGMRDVKAILVTKDGKWEPKLSKADPATSRHGNTDEQMGLATTSAGNRAEPMSLVNSNDSATVIVDLGDDEE